MSRFLLTTCLALTAAAIRGLPSWAGDEGCLHRTVSLTAADRDLSPIPDLKPEDFRGEFRGKPVKILSIVPDERPHRIVIALDASGSLYPGSYPGGWSVARRMASHLANSGLQRTSFALLVFNEDEAVRERVDFSQGSTVVAQKLREISADPTYPKIQVKGRTALWDTVLVGLGLIHDPTPADELCLITDGGENASKAHAREVRRSLAVSGSRIFVCLITGHSGNRLRAPEEQNGPEEMSEMAHATGGAVLGPMFQSKSGHKHFSRHS